MLPTQLEQMWIYSMFLAIRVKVIDFVIKLSCDPIA